MACRANGEGQKREYWLNKKIVKGRKQIRKEEAANEEGGKKKNVRRSSIVKSREKKVRKAITKTIMFQVVDGKYAVSVDWEPPLHADLPINKYKIFWSRRMQGETTIFNNLKEHKKTVQVSVYICTRIYRRCSCIKKKGEKIFFSLP